MHIPTVWKKWSHWEKFKSKEDLDEFLVKQILPSLEKLELPYLGFCYKAVTNRDYNELLLLNEEISAWKLTRELRDAGKSQGTQLLRMILEIHQCPVSRNLNSFCMRVESLVSRLQQMHF